MRYLILFTSLLLMTATLLADETRVLRVGHFPNLTHAAALVGHAQWRQNASEFEAKLGANVKVEWFTYNAGPQAMEALLSGSIDMAYVGPNPAINAYVRSKTEEVRIISGATYGGAALVVQGNGEVRSPPDFRGRRIGTPQLGNTQDVSARAWFLAHGLNVSIGGGEVQIVSVENPDLLTLFSTKQLDGVWTVEPWVTRLEREAGGKIFVQDDTSITTVLVTSTKLLASSKELVTSFNQIHKQVTAWIIAHPEEAKALVSEELKAETSRAVAPEVLNQAWPRLKFSTDISGNDLALFLSSAKRVGFLKEVSEITKIVHVLE